MHDDVAGQCLLGVNDTAFMGGFCNLEQGDIRQIVYLNGNDYQFDYDAALMHYNSFNGVRDLVLREAVCGKEHGITIEVPSRMNDTH